MQFVEANGARIPLIGLGTWELRGRTCARIVEQALRARLSPPRHRRDVRQRARGRGRAARLRRQARRGLCRHQDMAIALRAARAWKRAAKESLSSCDCPRSTSCCCIGRIREVPLSETLGALCKVKQAGLARHIGVSNFTVALIEEAVRLSSEPLVCNQIEMHPFLDQSKVVAACRAHGMAVVAYSPIARGNAPRTRCSRASARRTARRRRRSACAGWCSRASVSSRAPARSSGWRKISPIFDFELYCRRDARDRRARRPRRPHRRLRLFRIAEVGLSPDTRHRPCSPAGRIPPCAWPGRWSASRGSRPSASTTASATVSELDVRPRVRERVAALRAEWAARLGDDHLVKLDALAAMSDTALTREVAIEIAENGLPTTFVPGRNLVFFTFAGALAYRRGVKHLVGGHVRDRFLRLSRLPRRHAQGDAAGAQPRHGSALRHPYAADVDRQGGDLRARARARRTSFRRSAGRGDAHLLSRRPLAAPRLGLWLRPLSRPAGCVRKDLRNGRRTMSAALFETLRHITTGTITTMLLKKGIRRCWMNGPMPLTGSGRRIVGPAFTLRFVPVREDLATPESWSKPISTRGAIEDMPEGCIAVADAMGVDSAGIFGDILTHAHDPARRHGARHRRRRARPAGVLASNCRSGAPALPRRPRSMGSPSSAGRSRSAAAAARSFPATSSSATTTVSW